MNSRIMTSKKAEDILRRLKGRDRQNRKQWVPYQGPADFSFTVLNSPKKDLKSGEM